jgi:predicted transcriptional regulator
MIDQSLEIVRAAVRRFKKKPLADRASVSDAILRNVHDHDWDPRSTTLRKLEDAAAALDAEHGKANTALHGESARPIPAKGRA